MSSRKPNLRGAFGRRLSIVVASVLATLVVAGSTVGAPSPESGHVVLVELFTSQGCSSCPPADRLLTAIGGEDAGKVVPLAFHVDFWNSQGWTDPFSSREWTFRQVAYERALEQSQPYTPQAVIDGSAEVLGSDADKLRAAIRAAAERPAARLAIALAVAPSSSRVEVAVDVERPDDLRAQKLDLYAAVFETGLSTPVGRGENGGQTLRNDYVVRVLEKIGRLSKGDASPSHHATSLRLSKNWNAAHLGVAVFLQDPASLAVRGAAAQPLPASAP
ncbi:MAG TPA: DUF1223 domain-containing protein [Thermoanaerobaculia bacterium]|nr:DUF1223 domain-containing protein [Thermoanaerobaculia bacterium]